MDQALDILSAGKLLHVKVTGKLTKEDYEAFAPVVDEQIGEHGKIRIDNRLRILNLPGP